MDLTLESFTAVSLLRDTVSSFFSIMYYNCQTILQETIFNTIYMKMSMYHRVNDI